MIGTSGSKWGTREKSRTSAKGASVERVHRKVSFNEPFTVEVTVTNNDSVPQSFHITWQGAANPAGAGLTPGFTLPQDIDTGPIGPDSSATFVSPTYFYHWDWVPAQNPLTTDPTTYEKVTSAAKAAIDPFVDMVLEQIEKAHGLLEDSLGVLSMVADFVATKLPDILSLYEVRNPTIELDYTAVLSSTGAPGGSATDRVILQAPSDKKTLLAGSVLCNVLTPDIPKSVPAFDLSTYIVQTITMLMDDVSNLEYGEAYDATDSDYTTLVEPSVKSIPVLSNAPESPLKDFALSLDSLDSLEQAEATSRNRAQGAAAAGDLLWETRQLFAAAGFGLQAAFLETQMVGLGAQLAAIGGLTDPSSDENALQLLAANSLVEAQAELTTATQISVGSLHQPVLPLSTAMQQSLSAAQVGIQQGYSQSMPLGTLFTETQSYITQVLALINMTNNLPALQNDLDFGLGSLVLIQLSPSLSLPFVNGPEVVALHRLGIHAQPTQITLTFNEGVIQSGAENVANYRIIAACADGQFGPHDARTIRIKSAVYNPATDTVTLTPVHRLNWHRRYEIKVNGSSPTGLTDLFGNLLDGARNGKTGSDYVAVFRHWGIDPTYHVPQGPRTSAPK